MAGTSSTPSQAPPKTGAVRNAFRLASVLHVLVPQYRALRRFATSTADDAAPARFAASLVTLGPTFVKLGQMLSTRPDVMPQAYVDALSGLQEHGPEVPRQEIYATIENGLGQRVEALFATFEPKPVAAASLAQVLRACSGRALRTAFPALHRARVCRACRIARPAQAACFSTGAG